MWSPDERNGGDNRSKNGGFNNGSNREKHVSGSSSPSVNGRQRPAYNDYGTRAYDNHGNIGNNGRRSRGTGRGMQDNEMYRMQMNYEQQNTSNSVPGENMLQRRQWSGSSASLPAAHRSNSLTNRSPNSEPQGHHQESEPGTPTRKPLDVGSKLEEKAKDIAGPQIYMAAGTAPSSRFHSSVSPPSKMSSPVSSYAGPIGVPRPLPYPPTDESFEVKNRKTGQLALPELTMPAVPAKYATETRASTPVARNNKDGSNYQIIKRPQGSDQMQGSSNNRSQNTTGPFYPKKDDHRSILASLGQINALTALQQKLFRAQGSPAANGNRLMLSDVDLRQAMDRIASLTKEDGMRQPDDRSPDGGLAAAAHAQAQVMAAGLKLQQSLHPNFVGRLPLRANGTVDEAALLQRIQRAGGDPTLPEEMMPMLMRIMQTQAAGQQLAASVSDEARDADKKQQMHSQWSSMQPAMMQQLACHVLQAQAVAAAQSQTQVSQPPPLKQPQQPTSTPQSQKQNYSSVVARSTSSPSGASSQRYVDNRNKQTNSSHYVQKPSVNLQQRTPKREEKVPSTLLPLADRSSKNSNNLPAPTAPPSVSPASADPAQSQSAHGESGYQSESSPPLSLEQNQRPAWSGSSITSIQTNSPPRSKPPCPPPTAPLDKSGQFEVSKMDVLSEEIWHYHNSVTQTESMLSRKLHLRDMLYYSICPVFPMCGLYVVGSSLNGFGNNSSDMDLCLMITNKDLDQKTDAVVVLNMILSTLSTLDIVAQQKLILAKVPILRIKFAAPFADITVDLNANNSVAIKNTHLLCYYSSFDWRVRPLVSVVKEWAKRKGINDANRSSFTSYSLVLMVIHYLQCGAEQPILPSLQQMFAKRFSNKCDVRTLNVTTPLPPVSEDWQYSERATLGELLIGFLDYYANKFDYDHDAISVRQGKKVDRAVLARQRPSGHPNSGPWRSQWRCICIEEPFTLSNTAHSIYDEMVFEAIKMSLRDAHETLERTRDLGCLLNCEPIAVNAPVGGAVVFATPFDANRCAASSESPPSPPLPPSQGLALMGSSSANSLNTANSGSSASSSNGDELEQDRTSDMRNVVMSQLERPSQLPKSSGGRARRSMRKPTNSGQPLVPAAQP